jgi:hypothetical protein
MYLRSVFLGILPLATSCYLPNMPSNPEVIHEHVDVFTETVIRIRDADDPEILNLKEGQRISERTFKGVPLPILIGYFNMKQGRCNPPDHGASTYVCTMKKVVSLNDGRLGEITRNACKSLVYLSYEFHYPNVASESPMWSSMSFDAKAGSVCEAALR